MTLRSCCCCLSIGLLLVLCPTSGFGQATPDVEATETLPPKLSEQTEPATQTNDNVSDDSATKAEPAVPVAESSAAASPSANATPKPARPPKQKRQRAPHKRPTGLSQARTVLIHNTKIASTISGLITHVEVTAGQTITPDTVIIRLDDRRAKQELIAAEAVHRAATLESQTDTMVRYADQDAEARRAELQQAQLANQTYTGAVSEIQLRQLRLKVEQAGLKREQAELQSRLTALSATRAGAELEIAKENVARHIIRSSRGGIVAEVIAQEGQWVHVGQPVARVLSLDPIRVECELDPALIHENMIGQRVRFVPRQTNRDATSSESSPVSELHGEIRFVSSEVTSVSGRVVVWADMANPDGKVRSGVVGTLHLDDSHPASKDNQ